MPGRLRLGIGACLTAAGVLFVLLDVLAYFPLVVAGQVMGGWWLGLKWPLLAFGCLFLLTSPAARTPRTRRAGTATEPANVTFKLPGE